MPQLADAIQWEWAYHFWLEGRRIVQGAFDEPSRESFVKWFRKLSTQVAR